MNSSEYYALHAVSKTVEAITRQLRAVIDSTDILDSPALILIAAELDGVNEYAQEVLHESRTVGV